MKIAFSTSGDNLQSPLDGRFGRARRFLIYELEAESFELIDNAPNMQAVQGAGIQAAQAVIKSGAEAVVTGHCGPKALRVLTAADVKVYHSEAPTIADALEQYRLGQLPPAMRADVEGHWA